MRKVSVIGIVLLLATMISVSRLWQMEQRRKTEFEDIAETIEYLRYGQIKKENEGKIVAVSGRLTYMPSLLEDTSFGIEIATPILYRKVEMLQWTTHEQEEKIIYRSIWSEEVLPSPSDEDGYQNLRRMPIQSRRFASPIYLGTIQLTEEQIQAIPTDKIYNKIPMNRVFPYQLVSDRTYLHSPYSKSTSKTTEDLSENPVPGDIRISFHFVDPENLRNVTLLGKQSGNVLEPYTDEQGREWPTILFGEMDEAQLVNRIQEDEIFSLALHAMVALLTLSFSVYFFVRKARKYRHFEQVDSKEGPSHD